MARVFLSHASEDRGLAAEVHGWLTGQGHEVFLDQDLRAGLAMGELWEQRLFERLRWADAVLCLVTSAYVASPWCAAEVGIASSRGSRLLPLRAESGVSHPLLSSRHVTISFSYSTASRTRFCHLINAWVTAFLYKSILLSQ